MNESLLNSPQSSPNPIHSHLTSLALSLLPHISPTLSPIPIYFDPSNTISQKQRKISINLAHAQYLSKKLSPNLSKPTPQDLSDHPPLYPINYGLISLTPSPSPSLQLQSPYSHPPLTTFYKPHHSLFQFTSLLGTLPSILFVLGCDFFFQTLNNSNNSTLNNPNNPNNPNPNPNPNNSNLNPNPISQKIHDTANYLLQHDQPTYTKATSLTQSDLFTELKRIFTLNNIPIPPTMTTYSTTNTHTELFKYYYDIKTSSRSPESEDSDIPPIFPHNTPYPNLIDIDGYLRDYEKGRMIYHVYSIILDHILTTYNLTTPADIDNLLPITSSDLIDFTLPTINIPPLEPTLPLTRTFTLPEILDTYKKELDDNVSIKI